MPTELREGLRERKKRKTEKALQKAAIHFFSTRGFAETTVEDIADAAEVSPRTFFRYFPSKESVLITDLQDRVIASALADSSDELSIIETYLAAVASAFDGLTDEEWLVEQARMSLVVRTPELGAAALVAATTRPLADATDFIARRLALPPTDPRPRVYAALLLAAGIAEVTPLLARLADQGLDRATLLEAFRNGMTILEEGFPSGLSR